MGLDVGRLLYGSCSAGGGSEGSGFGTTGQASATASPASQDLSVTGTIAKLEFPVPEPNLTLIDKNETKWLMMMFKPLSIPIWQNNLRSRIEELRVGQQVKIVYTEQPDREKRVSSIEILTPTATTTPVTSSSTPSARIP